MSVALVTGSGGLVGASASRFLGEQGFDIVGIDNDMRSYFFGAGSSTGWSRALNEQTIRTYSHEYVDIRDFDALRRIFERYNRNISLIIHTAGQPSHDWAAREPLVDFSVNATGTLNLLELTRLCCPSAVFIFTSTNKVYGDSPNRLPLIERETRYDINPTHRFASGIDESLSIDHTLHSLFGASKAAADLLVQEYGRYFGMHTVAFRAGCITGSGHSGAGLHGFLSYLVKCEGTVLVVDRRVTKDAPAAAGHATLIDDASINHMHKACGRGESLRSDPPAGSEAEPPVLDPPLADGARRPAGIPDSGDKCSVRAKVPRAVVPNPRPASVQHLQPRRTERVRVLARGIGEPQRWCANAADKAKRHQCGQQFLHGLLPLNDLPVMQ
jgi:nucleoside-diphosphate-sugar epimerase